MKLKCCSLIFAGWLAAGLAQGASPAMQLLSDGWKLARVPDVPQSGAQISQAGFDDSAWISAAVPGTALGSYQAAGVIPDPYYGTNMTALELSGTFNTYYWYRSAFYVPAAFSGQKIWLNFKGVNWKADVYVNGSYLGRVSGPFTRGKFDLSSVAVPGATNFLAVQLIWANATVYDSPAFIAADSWDFMPAIAGRDVGLYQEVYLSTSGPVTMVDPFIATTLPLPATSPASLGLQVGLTNSSTGAVSGTLSGIISPEGIAFQTNVTINAASAVTLALSPGSVPQLAITNPALWWPNGYGPQNLHTLQLSFQSGGAVSDTQSVQFGIRQFGYNTNGHELQLSCNGQPILCKGGNWGMPDAMLGYTPAQVNTAVRLHKEMNFTMIRCWHGTSDLEAFYDACDQYGILVWDEFWLNGSNFGLGPIDSAMFMANAMDKYKRLRNRACLAVWCGENEAVPPASLNLPQFYAQLDGTRLYVDASNQGPIHGGGPYAVQDLIWYFGNAHGFTTEIGLPSIPPLESMQAMMPASSLWPMGDDHWQLHDWDTDIGNKGLPQYTSAVSSRYGAATGIADFCRKAQLLNLESYKAIFEAWNAKLWSDCSGVLLWMSQPAWPSTIWQTYDWYFELGGAFFGSKKGCEPVHIQWDADDNSVRLINATPRALNNLSARVQVYNLDGTLPYDTNLAGLALPANSVSNCLTLFGSGSDLALKQPACGSSIDNSGDAISNAVDGSLGTRWSSAYSDPQWFYVDLGAARTFNQVNILWESAYARAYQIQVSNDATNWTTIWSTNGMVLGDGGGYALSSFAPASARYVRMYGTQRATAWGYSMYEFQVAYNLGNPAANLSKVHFIKLRLSDSAGNLLSDNFYWRGTTAQDYTALSGLPAVSLGTSAAFSVNNGMTTITAGLTNASATVALGARLKVVNQATGARVLPVVFSDNYFSLVPGEGKNVTLEFSNSAASSGPLLVLLDGWNIATQQVLALTVSPAVPSLSPPALVPAGPLNLGAAATLVCSNWSGASPWSFQWQKSAAGGVYADVAGATTNSLRLPGLTTNDSGYYRLKFSAAGQAITSAVVPLSVLPTLNGGVPSPRLSVKFAADLNYGHDFITNGWGAGALNTRNWFSLYGPNGASNGLTRVPFYNAGDGTAVSGAVLVYSYSGEINFVNEQAQVPNNMALMDSYISVGNNGWYLSVTNLDAPFTNGYSVYFYYFGGRSGRGGQNYIRYYAGQTTNSALQGTRQWNLYTSFTNNDGHFTQDQTPFNSGVSSETAGANYCVFTNLSGGAFDLTMINGNYGGVSAIEVVANPVVAPVLSAQLEGGSLVLNWTGGSLVQATNLTGPWTAAGADSPYRNPATNPQMFYRVRTR